MDFSQWKIEYHASRIHERTVQILNPDHDSKFDELQKMVPSKFLTVIFRNYLIEIFKVNMKLAPEIMNDIFDIIEYTYPPTNKTFAL